MMGNSVEILDAGFACLVERLGIFNAERFIAMIKRDSFDYTIWRREYFDTMSMDELNQEAIAYVKKHPHRGNGVRI